MRECGTVKQFNIVAMELQLASLEGPVERVTVILKECVRLFEICIAGGVKGLEE